MHYGEPVQFEFFSADASTAAAIRIRKSGEATQYTLLADERLIIQSVSASLAAAVLWAVIYDDVGADGGAPANDEAMVVLSINSSHVNLVGTDGISGGKGRVPKVISGVAGLVKITGVGVIVKG